MIKSILLKKATFKMLFSILFINLPIILQAQTESPVLEPNFAPKTPEAASFLKYGEYPVDLSTGVPGISIPLYSVDVNGFKLPISLNYHASGIKVNQEATWVGLGWNLNAGAQVVLSPRDEIDENYSEIDVIPDDDAVIAYFKQHPYKHNDISMLNTNLDRSRIKDMYAFSSPTANGSFYIKNFANNEVVTIPPDAFKVDLIGGNRENMKFKITDPQGNVYLLNTKEVSVRTLTHDDRYISAWYVDEIKTPSNNTILFTYQDDGYVSDDSYSQKVEIKKLTKSDKDKCGAPFTTTEIGAVKDEKSSTLTNSKKIAEIIFNDGNSRVLFTTTSGREDLKNGNSYLKKLEIQQLAFDGFETVKGFTFQYSYFKTSSGSTYAGKRLKLDKIDDLMTGKEQQSFIYSNINLPVKESKSIDYFGFYNLGNNLDLIPKHYLSVPYATEVGNANRNVNASSNQAGILKEIHYPTKGFTRFNYETNQFYGVDGLGKYNANIINSSVIQGTGGLFPVKEKPGIDGMVCDNPDPADCVNYVSIPFTAIDAQGILTFELVKKQEGDNPTLMKYHYAKVRVFSNDTEVYNSGNLVGQPYNIPVTLPGSGTIEVEVYGQYYSVNNLQLKYVNNDPNPKNNLSAGLRIQSIENYDDDNTLLTKKEYEYNDIENPERSSGKLINDLSTTFITSSFKNYNFYACHSQESGSNNCNPVCDITNSSSITSNSRYGIEGNSVIYRYVKEKQIDVKNQSKNGYTLYEFSTDADDFPFGNNASALQIYTTWKRGKLVNRKVFKDAGLKSYLVEEEKNTYVEDASRTSFYSGFKMYRLGKTNIVEASNDPMVLACPYYAEGLDIRVLDVVEPLTFDIPILWFYQKSSEKTEYFYDTSNNLTGKLITNTNYNYNNPSHLQLSSQTITNSKGQLLESKYFYAGDTEMASSPFVNELITAHMIAIPLKTQTLKGGTKIAEQLTNYDKSVATANLLLPRYIYGNKGTAAIDLTRDKKLTYDLYDDRGNVLQYTRDGGNPVSIIWGYNKTQPVAKIENVLYSSVPLETISNIQTISNSDKDNCISGNCTEQQLRNSLDQLRNLLTNAFISTYTYNPFIGVTSVTDPKGMIYYYEYDDDLRLKYVRDTKGQLVTENIYHYKN